jgi:hypothetical protein
MIPHVMKEARVGMGMNRFQDHGESLDQLDGQACR